MVGSAAFVVLVGFEKYNNNMRVDYIITKVANCELTKQKVSKKMAYSVYHN